MIIGGYYLTGSSRNARARAAVPWPWEVFRALDEGLIDIHAPDQVAAARRRRPPAPTLETTPGRLLFEEALPADYTVRFGHIDLVMKREMGLIVERLVRQLPQAEGGRGARPSRTSATGTRRKSASPSRSTTSRRRRRRRRSSTSSRSAGGEGREPVPPGHHHRRRAPQPGGPHLDRGHRPRFGRPWRPSSRRSSSTRST